MTFEELEEVLTEEEIREIVAKVVDEAFPHLPKELPND